jgi:hypothetical protein
VEGSVKPVNCPKCQRPWADHTRAYPQQEPPWCQRQVEVENVRLVVRNDPKEKFAQVDICYPRSNQVIGVEVGIECVRAADAIRIHYDFERDGYVIQQARIVRHDDHDEEVWQEVYFAQAWALGDPDEAEGNIR